jgi:hypothetical protein
MAKSWQGGSGDGSEGRGGGGGRRRTTLIKSNNPHLAGVEQSTLIKHHCKSPILRKTQAMENNDIHACAPIVKDLTYNTMTSCQVTTWDSYYRDSR